MSYDHTGDAMLERRPSTTQPNLYPHRRRASKACFSCRARKVRCDATQRGTPCTNCRSSNASCMMAKSSRVVAHNTPPAASSAGSPRSDAEYLLSLSFDELGTHVSTRGCEPSFRESVRSASESPPAEPFTAAPPLSAHGLPSYIRDLPPHLTAADIDTLTRNGALTLPEEDLQHELFRKHILYAHAFLPVINLASFFSPIVRHETGQVSLLVYQALLFASAAYVDPEYSAERGYQGRKSLRKTFFRRARLLYDLRCETDPLAVLQALLLMTCWYEEDEGEGDATWKLMGEALALAKALGMHRNPDVRGDLTPHQRQLRKKIWWSCFVRDRLLSLGMGRPARIRPKDFDVPLLTMEECEMMPLEDDILQWVGPVPVADDCPTKANIYLCFVELVQLSVYIGDALLQRASILSNPASVMAGMLSTVRPRVSTVSTAAHVAAYGAPVSVSSTDNTLQGWQQSLTPGCRYTKDQGVAAAHRHRNESHRLLRLYQALLHIVYLTATAVLHQSHLGDGTVVKMWPQVLSREKVSATAADITDIIYELYDDDQLRFVPTVAIPALMSATLTHLMDIRAAAAGPVRYVAIGRFFQCWQALHCLRDMYASADRAVSFLESVITKTGIRIPMLTMLPMLRTVDSDVVDVTDVVDVEMEPPEGGVYEQQVYGPPPVDEPPHEPLDDHDVETVYMADPSSEAWNGIEIGEDLFQTLAVFNTHTAFSLGY